MERLSSQLSTSRDEAEVRNCGDSLGVVSSSMVVPPGASSNALPVLHAPFGSNNTPAASAMSATVALPAAPEAVPSQRLTTFAGFA
mmetsp:Transcript_89535/g.175244  ORF Transcript_89535/g.175244 Transcript_89535/m.175244 type:complete len:86 (-) Transcript_89535:226-483(-)